MPEARIIKRYANRKMYDTSRSCYVTLEEVAEMVREGHEVRVIDNTTKDDLTEVTLAQVLADSGRKRRGSVPLKGMMELITQGNAFLSKKVAEPVSRVKEGATRSVTHWRDEAGKTVHSLRTEAEKVLRKDGSVQVAVDTPAETQGKGVKPASAESQRDEAAHSWLEERMRHLVHALGLHTGDGEPAVVPQLMQRIAELEARVAALEARGSKSRQPPAAG